jgi:hypothetical protein
MEPRFGRLYASAVLRPLAEQVVGFLGVRPGETACDLLCDGGTLAVAMGAAVGSQGRVVLVDTDPALLNTALPDVSATGCGVSTQVAIAGGAPLAGESCDRVASLCTLGFWEGGSLLKVAEYATRPGGRAAMLTWDVSRPPLHETALADAIREVVGIDSPFLVRCLASPDPDESVGWQPVTVQDVVRFDGIGSYWSAMVDERPIAGELARESEAALRDIRAVCQRALDPCTAADGTMRIPIRATLWCSSP